MLVIAAGQILALLRGAGTGVGEAIAHPWCEIGYVRPQRWIASLIVGIAIGVALQNSSLKMIACRYWADPINQAYHYLAGNRTAAAPFVFQIIVIAGFGERDVFRGTCLSASADPTARAGAQRLFGALNLHSLCGAHFFEQGLPGSEQAMVTGLVFGTIFAITGRIWMPMCAHAAFDLTALAIIYWDLESAVAHFLVK